MSKERELQTSSEIALTIADALEHIIEGVKLARSKGIECVPPMFVEFTTEVSAWGDTARFTVHLTGEDPYEKPQVEEKEFTLEHAVVC